jgi:hypothetical protein
METREAVKLLFSHTVFPLLMYNNKLNYMIAQIIFIWYLITGTVIYQHDVEGRNTYALFFPDGKVVDYAYKAEIIEYIETGTFEYDDTLEDKVTDADKGE